MPDCQNCTHLRIDKCLAFPPEWPQTPVNALRACVVGITQEYCSLITRHSRVLEVGCGAWSPVRQHCINVGAKWEGIEISGDCCGLPSIATRIESVEALSFPDGSFDIVIGNQTLEHWYEYGCRMQVGLWQCFRVCTVGGWVLMNVPIHFHGARMFVSGDLPSIEALFTPYSNRVSMSAWRRNPGPLRTVQLLPGSGAPSAYNLDIRAQRTTEVIPPRPSPYRVRIRLWRELRDHGWSDVSSRAQRRLRALCTVKHRN